MANTAYTVEPLELIDGTVINLRPLPIKYYRVARDRMVKVLENGESFEDEMAIVEEMLDISVFCLKNVSKEWPEDYDFEESLDTDTMYKVLAVCTGVDIKKMTEQWENVNPETLAQMMIENQKSGTTDSQN